jgi:hypothetical protein
LHEVSRLKFLGPDHGHEQIDEQQQGNDAHDEVFHNGLLQFLAEADVKAAHGKEADDDSDEDQIIHKLLVTNPALWSCPLSARAGPDMILVFCMWTRSAAA